MSIKKIGQNILQAVFFGYLKLLEKTVHMEWDEDRLYGNSQIFGFWHEDSFIMNLVLKNLRGKTAPVDVIVTADTRGNYIEHMIKKCGGNALRIPDGYAAFGALKKLMQSSYEQSRSLAIALDGPLGPRHEPKKLAFYLSEQSGDDFVGISVHYSSCFRMFWRWDHYAVPLPFSTVTVAIRDYGEVSKRAIPHLPVTAAVSGVTAPAMARESHRPVYRAGQMIKDTLRYQKIV